MRLAPSALILVPLLAGCFHVTSRPSCAIDEQELEWEELTDLGVPADRFDEIDVSGAYAGEYDEGQGPVGVAVTVDRGAGKPQWVTSTPSSIETRSFGFGGSTLTIAVYCTDGLTLPTRTLVATDDGELTVDASGSAFIPADDATTTWPMGIEVQGSAPFDADDFPEWALEDLDRMDRTYGNARLTVEAGELIDGFAGWGGEGEDAQSSFAVQRYVVAFPVEAAP